MHIKNYILAAVLFVLIIIGMIYYAVLAASDADQPQVVSRYD